jgi:hypothetical protein
VVCIDLAENEDRWLALAKVVKNMRAQKNAGKIFDCQLLKKDSAAMSYQAKL